LASLQGTVAAKVRFAGFVSCMGAAFLAACGEERKTVVPPVDAGNDGGTIRVDAGEDSGPEDAGSDASLDAGDAAPPLLGLGEPCTTAAECESDVCLPADLGGTCTPACAHNPDCEARDEVCLVLPVDADVDGTPDDFRLGCGAPREPGYTVGNLCEAHDDCRNRRCDSEVCSAPCVDASDCAFGMACVDVLVGFVAGTYPGCGFSTRLTDPQVDEFDMGDVTIARDGGGSTIVGLAIPPDAVSFAVNALQTDEVEPLAISFTSVYDPDVDLLLSAGDLGSGDDQPLRCFPWLHVDTMLMPNSTVDRLEIQTGLYTWRNVSVPQVEGGAWPEIDVHLTAYIKRAGAVLDAGTLDINLWMVDIGVSAAEAPANARIQNALDELDVILAQAGMVLGDVTYYDAPAGDAGRLGVIDTYEDFDSELSDLFRLSDGLTGFAVNVFYVRAIAGSILGIAGGVPGPVKLHGTLHSGVAVEGEPGVLNAAQLAAVTGHEVGHYLGLFHPTENPGRDPLYDDDPIADTVYGDNNNLMHWAADLGTPNTELSAGQGFVLLRNPAVR